MDLALPRDHAQSLKTASFAALLKRQIRKAGQIGSFQSTDDASLSQRPTDNALLTTC